jgi:hypothetical protein
MEFLKEEKVRVLPWPAKSPDLNPIENMWSIVKRRIRVPLSATEGHAVLGRHVSRTDGERWSGANAGGGPAAEADASAAVAERGVCGNGALKTETRRQGTGRMTQRTRHHDQQGHSNLPYFSALVHVHLLNYVVEGQPPIQGMWVGTCTPP